MLFPVFLVQLSAQSDDILGGVLVGIALFRCLRFAHAPIHPMPLVFSCLFFFAPWLYMGCGLRRLPSTESHLARSQD